MSYQATRYACDMLADTADLTTGDRLVLLILADYANHRTGDAYPSVGKVAGVAGMHPSSVRRCLDRLARSGLIAVVNRPGKASTYRFPLDPPLSTVRAPGRAVDNPDPAPVGAYPAPLGAHTPRPSARRTVREQVIEQRCASPACRRCDGTGWIYTDDNHVEPCTEVA